MPRPKGSPNTPTSVPQRHAVTLRNEGNRMNSEADRLHAEAKLLLQAADVLDQEPGRKPVQYVAKQEVAA